jgi:RNA polymerase sigma factor (sigma-70 family)
MQMRATRTNDTALVVAAQSGDLRARDELAAAYLPLVYTVVRRALDGDPDVDDVVQDVMVRALRQLPALRSPENFRPWLTAIALRQIGTHLRRTDRAAARTTVLGEAADLSDPDAPSEDATLLQIELSAQRRQVRRAGRWLDAADRAVLPVWWLEAADVLSRSEVAAALGVSVAHAGVRVQRLRAQLELCRAVVAAVEARPRCGRLDAVLSGWDGTPGPLWRKRIARHLRGCAVCGRATAGMVPTERLLPGLALLPVPAGVAAAVLAPAVLSGTAAGVLGSGAAGLAGVGVKVGLLGQVAQAVAVHPVIAAVAAGTLAAGGAVTATRLADPPPPPPPVTAAPAPTAALPARPTGRATTAPAATAPAGTPARPATAEPTPSGTASLSTGTVSLEAQNSPGRFVSTAGEVGVLETAGPGSAETVRQRVTFRVVPGLADAGCFSFRSPDGRYLRHASWRVRLNTPEDSALYRGDATFCVRAGAVPGSLSLESANYPGWFLRHVGDELWVDQSDDSAGFRADSSFRARPPLAG